MTLGGPKRFLLKNREKKIHISGVARKLENVSCVLLQKSAIKTEKVFFPFTSQLVILLWSTVASGRRIMAIVVFFLPSLGLFSILNHWKAEQLPFYIRMDAFKYDIMTPDDIIALNKITRTFNWTSIDRWNYKQGSKPQPPPYSLYTGLSLGHTFKAFLILTVLHIIAISVVKIITVKKTEKESWFNFMVHILENICHNNHMGHHPPNPTTTNNLRSAPAKKC